MSIPMHYLGPMKFSAATAAAASGVGGGATAAPAATAPGSPATGPLTAVAASLGLHRRRRQRQQQQEQQQQAPVEREGLWRNPFSPTRAAAAASTAAATAPATAASLARAVSSVDATSPPLHLQPPPPLRPPGFGRELSAPTAGPATLDAVTLAAPPHVAVRYGDTLRLFARSRFIPASSADSGGYVGTYEIGKQRFGSTTKPRASLACVPPVRQTGALLYRPSTFTIHSTNGAPRGSPVSYGDVVVLVDERGRVWNNKLGNGVAPTTLGGYFGPREPQTPGEMYLSLYQLPEPPGNNGNGRSSSTTSSSGGDSSDSDDDDDPPLTGEDDDEGFLQQVARTTRSMADSTFGRPTPVELELAATALRTVGRVVYYGDRNVIIDVADSNRTRSKFNRVLTHAQRKDDGGAVRGGYLRCDGRGKPLTFELHGPPLPAVASIDVCTPSATNASARRRRRRRPMRNAHAGERASGSGRLDDDEDSDAGDDNDVDPTDDAPADDDDGDGTGADDAAASAVRASTDGDDEDTEDDHEPMLCAPSSSSSSSSWLGDNGIAVGRAMELRNVQPASVVSIYFSDGGRVQIPCRRFLESGDAPFARVVLGGHRPLRLHVRVSPARPRPSLQRTLRSTYRELMQLFGAVAAVSSVGALAASRLLHVHVSIPALLLGGVAVLVVFVIELFFPGRLVRSHRQALMGTAGDHEASTTDPRDRPFPVDWRFTIVSIEASASERIVSKAEPKLAGAKAAAAANGKTEKSIPKSFIVAEDGNMVKAMQRYEATMAWRREVHADAVLATPQHHYAIIKQYYHQFGHKRDKLGHPIYIKKIASINMKALQKAGVTQEDLFQHFLFSMEFTLKYVANTHCQCPACATSDTQKLFLIVDARGIGMKDISGEAAEFVRKCTGIMQKHYPQRSYKIFFVNVPSWFGMAWKGIKPLLNETTRAKTNIVSESDTPAALLAHIDPENLPVEYGGTCACPGGCTDNSPSQRLQKVLVDCVLSNRPFVPEEADGWCGNGPSACLDDDKLREGSSTTLLTSDSSLRCTSETDFSSIDLAVVGVIRAGYLLKRPVKHKHFNPIWHRRFFMLHDDSLRFSKEPQSELYQLVPLSPSTTVHKATKGNNAFEVVTPLMAKNSHSLMLYAPSSDELNKWVDAIQAVIDRKGTASKSKSPLLAETNANGSHGDGLKDKPRASESEL